jgi:hypothetical protein
MNSETQTTGFPSLKRRQLFEFCDQPWLPELLREAELDCLNFIHHVFQPYYRLTGPIADWLAKSGTHKLLDLGSGGAEQIAMLIKQAKSQGVHATHFVLSDLYPNVNTWQELQRQYGEDNISYMEQPLSAMNMQGVSLRHWSIFSAFHHFAPEDVQKLLQQLIQNGDGLCIAEFTNRRWFDLAPMILSLPVHLVVPFFAKEFKWSKLLFTTIIPIVPLIVAFDGIVSVLRSYKKEEIIALLPSDYSDQFDVQYTEVWWRFTPLKATMLTLSRKK